MRWVRSSILLICLAAMLSSPLSADGPTTLSRSLRQRILNADQYLQLAEDDLRTVKQQWATAKRLNDESESDWIAREADWQLREKRLESEISRLKAEKTELEQQEKSSERGSEILIDLREQLAVERKEADRSQRRSRWKGRGEGALAGAALTALLVVILL